MEEMNLMGRKHLWNDDDVDDDNNNNEQGKTDGKVRESSKQQQIHAHTHAYVYGVQRRLYR